VQTNPKIFKPSRGGDYEKFEGVARPEYLPQPYGERGFF
jgi:hypothetical protein